MVSRPFSLRRSSHLRPSAFGKTHAASASSCAAHAPFCTSGMCVWTHAPYAPICGIGRAGRVVRKTRQRVRREARRHHDVAASSSLESRRAGPTCDLHRVALDASRAEIAAVFSGVAARAPLIVTRPPRVRDSDWSRHAMDETRITGAPGFPARKKRGDLVCAHPWANSREKDGKGERF